jgi:hypothetical protein
MTQYIRAVPDQPVVWPYSIRRLAVDYLEEAGGYISINAPAELFEAAPFYVFPVVEVEAPELSDVRTKRVIPADPVLGGDGIWRTAWIERDATTDEIAWFDQLNAPAPEWIGFQRALMADAGVNALLATCLSVQAAPLGGATIYGGLVVGLGQVAQGASPATFLEAWRGGMMAGLVTAELAEAVADLAAPFNLPAAFLEGLMP